MALIYSPIKAEVLASLALTVLPTVRVDLSTKANSNSSTTRKEDTLENVVSVQGKERKVATATPCH